MPSKLYRSLQGGDEMSVRFNFESDIRFLTGRGALRNAAIVMDNMGCRRVMIICDESKRGNYCQRNKSRRRVSHRKLDIIRHIRHIVFDWSNPNEKLSSICDAICDLSAADYREVFNILFLKVVEKTKVRSDFDVYSIINLIGKNLKVSVTVVMESKAYTFVIESIYFVESKDVIAIANAYNPAETISDADCIPHILGSSAITLVCANGVSILIFSPLSNTNLTTQ